MLPQAMIEASPLLLAAASDPGTTIGSTTGIAITAIAGIVSLFITVIIGPYVSSKVKNHAPDVVPPPPPEVISIADAKLMERVAVLEAKIKEMEKKERASR